MTLKTNLKKFLVVILAGIALTACATQGKGFSAKLWSIDLTGYNERLIETETDGSDPSWSSLLSK